MIKFETVRAHINGESLVDYEPRNHIFDHSLFRYFG